MWVIIKKKNSIELKYYKHKGIRYYIALMIYKIKNIEIEVVEE